MASSATFVPKHVGYQSLASIKADQVVVYDFKARAPGQNAKVTIDFNFFNYEIRLRCKDAFQKCELVYSTSTIEELDLSDSVEKMLVATISLQDGAVPKVVGDNIEHFPMLQQVKAASIIQVQGSFKVDLLLQNAQMIQKSLEIPEGINSFEDYMTERLDKREQALPAKSNFEFDPEYRQLYTSGLATETEATRIKTLSLKCEAMLRFEAQVGENSKEPTGNWFFHVAPLSAGVPWRPKGSQKFIVSTATSEMNRHAVSQFNTFFINDRQVEAYLLEDNDKDSYHTLFTTCCLIGGLDHSEVVTLTPVIDERASKLLMDTIATIDGRSVIYPHLLNPTTPQRAEIIPVHSMRLDPNTLPEVQRLNSSQIDAFNHALDHDITLVIGPPGTGKTATIVAVCVYLMKHGLKVLIIAPSNHSANQLALKINEAMPGKVLRVCSRTVERKASSFYKAGIHEAIESTLPAEIRQICFTPVFRSFMENERDDQEAPKATRDMAADLLRMMAALKRGELEKEGREGLKKLKDIFLEKFWKPFDAAVATSQVSSHPDLRKFNPWYVIGDEVAATSEPSTLVPFQTFAESIRGCFLVGDPRQFPPYLDAKEGKGISNLSTSLHERFIMNGWNPNVLTTQYRMHPVISSFYKRYMYPDYDIQDGRGDNPRWTRIIEQIRVGLQVPEFSPASFLNVLEQEPTAVCKGASWENAVHAEKIKEFVYFLHQLGVTADEIVVLTPYSAQRRLLSLSLKGLALVVTLDSYMGNEREVAIIDMVVSTTPSPFCVDPRRINVGTTRAQEILMMVGSGHAIMNLLPWKRERNSVKGKATNLLKRFVEHNVNISTYPHQPLFPQAT